MKRLLLFLALFVVFVSNAQIHKIQSTGYKQLTTAQRDALVVPATEYWVIYNATTSQFEYWNGATWEKLNEAAMDSIAIVKHPIGGGYKAQGLTKTLWLPPGAYSLDLMTHDGLADFGSTGVTGANALGIGNSSLLSGYGSFNVGDYNRATNDYSTTIGYDNDALGYSSMAVGFGNVVNGTISFTQGYLNTNNGYASASYGLRNILGANANYSFTAGILNDVNYTGQFGSGLGIQLKNGANYEGHVGVGIANIDQANQVFSVGNGDVDLGGVDPLLWSVTTRSNAFTVFKDGTVYAPSLSVAEITAANDSILTTKGYTTQAIADAIAGGGFGNVSKVGTPVDNQIAVWTGDGTVEGTSGLTYDGTEMDVTGNIASTGKFVVGSNTVDPSFLFHAKSTGASIALFERTTNATAALSFKNTVQQWYFGAAATNGNWSIGTSADLNTSKFTIHKTTGNVAIGNGYTVSGAEEKLVVDGNIKAEGSIYGGVQSFPSAVSYTTNGTENGMHIDMTGGTTITLDDASVVVGDQFTFFNNTGAPLTFAYGTGDTAIQGTLPSLPNGKYAWASLKATNSWSVIVGEEIPTAGISNIVEDTTPQLGGTLDMNFNDIQVEQTAGQYPTKIRDGGAGIVQFTGGGSTGFNDTTDKNTLDVINENGGIGGQLIWKKGGTEYGRISVENGTGTNARMTFTTTQGGFEFSGGTTHLRPKYELGTEITGNITINALTDLGKVFTVNSATPVNITINSISTGNNTRGPGQVITFIQKGAGAFTLVAGGGITINTKTTLVSDGQWSIVEIMALTEATLAIDSWLAYGNLVP